MGIMKRCHQLEQISSKNKAKIDDLVEEATLAYDQRYKKVLKCVLTFYACACSEKLKPTKNHAMTFRLYLLRVFGLPFQWPPSYTDHASPRNIEFQKVLLGSVKEVAISCSLRLIMSACSLPALLELAVSRIEMK